MPVCARHQERALCGQHRTEHQHAARPLRRADMTLDRRLRNADHNAFAAFTLLSPFRFVQSICTYLCAPFRPRLCREMCPGAGPTVMPREALEDRHTRAYPPAHGASPIEEGTAIVQAFPPRRAER